MLLRVSPGARSSVDGDWDDDKSMKIIASLGSRPKIVLRSPPPRDGNTVTVAPPRIRNTKVSGFDASANSRRRHGEMEAGVPLDPKGSWEV